MDQPDQPIAQLLQVTQSLEALGRSPPPAPVLVTSRRREGYCQKAAAGPPKAWFSSTINWSKKHSHMIHGLLRLNGWKTRSTAQHFCEQSLSLLDSGWLPGSFGFHPGRFSKRLTAVPIATYLNFQLVESKSLRISCQLHAWIGVLYAEDEVVLFAFGFRIHTSLSRKKSGRCSLGLTSGCFIPRWGVFPTVATQAICQARVVLLHGHHCLLR